VSGSLQERFTNSRKYPEFYMVGSQIYKTNDEKSDYDIFVPMDVSFKVDLQYQEGEFNFHVKDDNTFKKLIKEHHPFTLTVLFVPDEFIFSEIELSRTEIHFLRQEFNLNISLLKKNFIEEMNLCIHKSERYFSSNKRISLKNLIHAIRYLMFGIQIVENQKITDYTVANEFFYKIFKIEFETWEEYFLEFKEIIGKYETIFLDKVQSSMDKFIKYDKPSKGKLATLEFIKDHSLEEFEKYFPVGITKRKFGYYINSNSYSNNELYSSLIFKELSEIMLSPTLELLAWRGYQILDWKHPNASKLTGDLFKANDYFTMIFHDGENWVDHFGRIIEIFQIFEKENVPKEKVFVFSDDERIMYIVDRITMEKESYDNYLEILEKAGVKKSESVKMNSIEIQEHLADIGYYREKLVLRDSSMNMVSMNMPMVDIVNQLNGGQISERDAFLKLIKHHPRILNTVSDYLDDEVHHSKLHLFDSLVKKFKKLINEIQSTFKEESVKEFEIIYDFMKKGKDIESFFIQNDVDTLEKLLEVRSPSKKELAFIPNVNLVDLIPKEVFEIVFSYLTPKELKFISILVSPSFEWISSNEYLSNEITSRSGVFYDKETFENLTPFFNTPKFQLYSRVLPYKSKEIGKSISLYDNLYLISPRELNKFEQELFHIPEKMETKPLSIVSFEEFNSNLNKFFSFDKWKDSISWRNFKMVGGSILKCLLKDPFESKGQDIDLFFYGDYYLFDSLYYRFYIEMSQYSPREEFHDDYEDRVRTMYLNFDGEIVTFQFVLYNSELKNDHFFQLIDQDCCQVGFDGEKVISSYSFIQSLNTGTFMNYHLMENNIISEHARQRVEKYSKRGFCFMSPKSFNFSNCVTLEEIEDSDTESSTKPEEMGEIEDSIEEKKDSDSEASPISKKDIYQFEEARPFDENKDSLKMLKKTRRLLK
jgi:hypothetical protein